MYFVQLWDPEVHIGKRNATLAACTLVFGVCEFVRECVVFRGGIGFEEGRTGVRAGFREGEMAGDKCCGLAGWLLLLLTTRRRRQRTAKHCNGRLRSLMIVQDRGRFVDFEWQLRGIVRCHRRRTP